MNRRSLFLLSIFSMTVRLMADQVSLHGVTIDYALPSKEYFKEYDINPYQSVQHLVVKFPSVNSDRYQLPIIPNLQIRSEKVPEGVTSMDFMFNVIENVMNFDMTIESEEDDIMECGLPGHFSFFSQYESSGIIHNVYHVCTVYNEVAIYVLFDASDDIYLYYRETLEEILSSMTIVKK